MEKRHNYVRKVAETAVQMYISNDKPNVAGLVLAGSADFKTELSQSDMFDPVSTYNLTHNIKKYACMKNVQPVNKIVPRLTSLYIIVLMTLRTHMKYYEVHLSNHDKSL